MWLWWEIQHILWTAKATNEDVFIQAGDYWKLIKTKLKKKIKILQICHKTEVKEPDNHWKTQVKKEREGDQRRNIDLADNGALGLKGNWAN